MKKILILNPPTKGGIYINRDQMGGMGQKLSFGKSLLTNFLRKMKSNFIRQPVLQLVYAASILAEKNKILVIDALNENLSLDEVLKKAGKFNPDFVIIAVSSADIEYERDGVAKLIKQKTKAKIITVGDTIVNAPYLFKKPFDIAIIGEIEKIIQDIINEKKLEKIHGIIYFKNQKIKTNKKDDFLNEKELDKLPFPKWTLFSYKKYRYYPLLDKEPVVSMLSSRGCPYGCYYCSYSENEGRKLRLRSPKNVVDEMEFLIKKYGIKGVIFRDPLFTGNKERTEKICRLLIKKNINLIWGCETRPELLDEKLLNLMYKSGCRAINLGIESIHEKELKAVGRNKIDLNHLKKIINYCNKIGIRTTGFFILGLPNSTKKSMNETIRFSIKSGLAHGEYKIATPYPGTKLREIAIKNKWIKNEGELGGYNAVMEINGLNKDYLNKLCDKAFKQFYYRVSWIKDEFARGGNLKKIKFMLKTIYRIVKNE